MALILLSVCLLFGCQSHPINRSPEPVEKGGIAYGIPSPASEPVDRDWWASFNDAKLDTIIRKALDNNLNIMRGLARLEHADALTRQSKAERLPQIDLEANILRDWAVGDTRNRLNWVGGALAWEVDVFNRLGSAALARQSERAARLEDLLSIRLSQSAEVNDIILKL